MGWRSLWRGCCITLSPWKEKLELKVVITVCEKMSVGVLRSAEELGQLQNAALAASVKRERLRLARLHAHLFRQPAGSGPGSVGSPEPSISLESFVWAHCLVRSRALDLTADQER